MKYSVQQYAHKKKVTRQTVYNWVRRKQLPIGTEAKVYCGGLCIEVHELPEEVKRKIVKAIEENI